jgi:hypothetical protein
LSQTSEITGRVHLDDLCGEPLGGASVVLTGQYHWYLETTGPNGLFDFSDLSPGSYQVAADKTHFWRDYGECGGSSSEASIDIEARTTVIQDLMLDSVRRQYAVVADCYTLVAPKTPPIVQTSLTSALLDGLDPIVDGDARLRYAVVDDAGSEALASWCTPAYEGQVLLAWGINGWAVKDDRAAMDAMTLGGDSLSWNTAESLIGIVRAHSTVGCDWL